MRAFLQEYHPYAAEDYQGFLGFEMRNGTNETTGNLVPRAQDDFYYPIHFIAPIPGSEAVLDLDMYSRNFGKVIIDKALQTWEPTLSEPVRLVEETVEDALAVVLVHPGTPVSTQPDLQPRDIVILVIRIPDLIKRATATSANPASIFLYDRGSTSTTRTSSSYSNNEQNDPSPESSSTEFILGYVRVRMTADGEKELSVEQPVPLDEIRRTSRLYFEETVSIADRQWTIAIIDVDGTYRADIVYVVLGSGLLFLCSLSVAAVVFSNLRSTEYRRRARLRQVQLDAQAEKAALILDNAKQATAAERTLNDFIAHEVSAITR